MEEHQQRRTSLNQDTKGAVQRVLSLTRASAKAVDKLAGSAQSETSNGSRASDMGKHDLLLRLFESQWFSPFMALHYLQNPQPGVEVSGWLFSLSSMTASGIRCNTLWCASCLVWEGKMLWHTSQLAVCLLMG